MNRIYVNTIQMAVHYYVNTLFVNTVQMAICEYNPAVYKQESRDYEDALLFYVDS